MSTLSPDRIVSSKELADELSKLPPQKFFKSGLEGLDTLLKGFAEGDFIVVAGEQKSGKTTLCATLTRRFTQQDIPCLWFSVELPYQELFDQVFRGDPPLFYLPRTRDEKSVQWIEKKIKEAVEKFGIKVVFIDHLGLVRDEKTFLQRNSIDIIDERIAQLRELALKYRICLFGVSEYNKESINKADKTEMKTGNLRGTARLGYTASAVIGIERLAGVKTARVWQDIKNQPEDIFLKTDMWIYVLDCRRSGARKIKIKCYQNDMGDICEYEMV